MEIKDPHVYVNDKTGKLFLYKHVLAAEAAEGYFHRLNEETPWETEKIVMMGRHLELRRKVAAYGDDGKSLRYAGKIQKSVVWAEAIRELKETRRNADRTKS